MFPKHSNWRGIFIWAAITIDSVILVSNHLYGHACKLQLNLLLNRKKRPSPTIVSQRPYRRSIKTWRWHDCSIVCVLLVLAPFALSGHAFNSMINRFPMFTRTHRYLCRMEIVAGAYSARQLTIQLQANGNHYDCMLPANCDYMVCAAEWVCLHVWGRSWHVFLAVCTLWPQRNTQMSMFCSWFIHISAKVKDDRNAEVQH